MFQLVLVGSTVSTSSFAMWSLLDMPAYAVLSLPDLQVRELCFALEHL